jgi:hypothetical protein
MAEYRTRSTGKLRYQACQMVDISEAEDLLIDYWPVFSASIGVNRRLILRNCRWGKPPPYKISVIIVKIRV